MEKNPLQIYSLFIISAMLFVHPRLNSHWDAERVSDLLHLVWGSPLQPVTSILTSAHTFSWSIRNQPFCSSATRSSKLFTKLTITFWDSALNYWPKLRCYFQSARGLKMNVSGISDLVICSFFFFFFLFVYIRLLSCFFMLINCWELWDYIKEQFTQKSIHLLIPSL